VTLSVARRTVAVIRAAPGSIPVSVASEVAGATVTAYS
jgi:hypothetical protein